MNTTDLATYKDVALLFLKYGSKLGVGSDEFAGTFEVTSTVEPSEDGKEFARDLEKLGPTFVKLGQLLSTRADIIPPDWMAALQRLQDDVEPVPMEDIREVVEAELGGRISKLFEDFDETPLATASLGQVHRATLRNSGKEVVVKVQRPNIRERVLDELDAIAKVTSWVDEHTEFGRKYEAGRIVSQMRRSIVKELNYNEEAMNLERLAQNLEGADLLVVPGTYSDFSSERVLTMDYVAGTNITDLSGVVHVEVNGEQLAEVLFAAYLKQVLIDGFFHADPHPGNILLTPDRRLALLDLGMVGTVPDQLKDQLLQLLAAIAEGRSSDAAEITQSIGTPREHYEMESCKEAIVRLVEDRKGQNVEQLQVGQMVMEVTQVCGEHGLRIPDSMFMLGKMLLNLDIIGKTLDPKFNPDAAIRRHTGPLAQHRLKDHLSFGGVLHFLTDVKELFSQTPGRINDFLTSLAENDVKVSVDAIDENKLLRGFHRVANRITVGLILAAMIVGAAMMMNIESRFTLFGYPGLAILFFLAAAIGGLLLVGSIMISELKHKS
ncbi:MAG: AarF/ABC1/UbiB kinase family protein [Verrucomicrobiales bacterium]|nr:AarF/ABC1/UbiB kinase family protein [Verrucomicrobiales bacterium]